MFAPSKAMAAGVVPTLTAVKGEPSPALTGSTRFAPGMVIHSVDPSKARSPKDPGALGYSARTAPSAVRHVGKSANDMTRSAGVAGLYRLLRLCPATVTGMTDEPTCPKARKDSFMLMLSPGLNGFAAPM